MIAPHL